VVSWLLSDSLEIYFVLTAVDQAFSGATPTIIDSDQGSHFTSPQYISRLKLAQVNISLDGKGQEIDNIITERHRCSIKYEEVYLKEYGRPKEARQGLTAYLDFYNHQRLHQSLDYATPAEVYYAPKYCGVINPEKKSL